MNNLNFLQKSVLATLAYYDIFDYPLTGLEVFKFLINPLHVVALTEKIHEIEFEPMPEVVLADVLNCLDNFSAKGGSASGGKNTGIIGEKNGFYFTKGRESLIDERIERQKISAQRWKKALKILKLLQFVPFLEMVSVCNSLAIDNSKKEADIDFFIITKKGRIWMVRFLVTFLVWISGFWRHKDKISGRICLSFYIADDFLNINSLAINPYDIYLAHWIAELKPILNRNKTYEEFIAQNQWVRDYLLNFGQFMNFFHPEFKESIRAERFRKAGEFIFKGFIGNLKEKILRCLQKRKISRKMAEHEIPTAVVVSNRVLKFHENDKRAYFQQEFLKKLKSALSIDNNNNKC